MATLNIKALPDALYSQLRERARGNHRSIAQEVTHILTHVLQRPEPVSLLDLEGLGKALWADTDAAEHVAKERDEQLFTRASHPRVVDIDQQQLRAATQLRAVHGVRTPDALQRAAGLATRATTMITNDRRLPEIPGLDVLQLSNLV